VRVGCGRVPARNPSGENTRVVKPQIALRFVRWNGPIEVRFGTREPHRGHRRPGAMLRPSLPLLAAVLLIAACSGTASSPPGSSPAPSPSPGLGIEHATGATDVVLRYDQAGGFTAPSAMVTHGPIFSLYGDGTIVFRDVTEAPPQTADGLGRGTPYRTAKLSEPQIQALLQEAINQGALGIARAEYLNNRIADAPTTVFVVHAGGLDKTVSVMGLGIDQQPGPDALTLTALAKLAERLGQFNAGTGFATELYVPERYRALLMEAPMGDHPAPIAWPWPDIKPADFAVLADNLLSFPIRTVTAADVAKLKLPQIEGGLIGVPVKAPDGKVYQLALRPLLPDEKS
jgi:hypothetical protein